MMSNQLFRLYRKITHQDPDSPMNHRLFVARAQDWDTPHDSYEDIHDLLEAVKTVNDKPTRWEVFVVTLKEKWGKK
jgi:hypothetical protein